MDLFKLVGSIFIDNEAANDSLGKTDKKASSVGESLGKAAKGAAAVGTAVVAGATAVGTAIVSMASDSASAMDVIDKGSQRMEISAESYQELAHAASLSGVEMGTLEKAAKKLSGTGINLDDALEQIYSLGTAEERAQKASELFGDSIAYSLTPMLNASGEDFRAMRQEANDLGLVMSGDAVAAGAALNDKLSNVHDAVSALTTNLGNSLAPVVGDFCDLIIEHMPEIQALFEKLSPIIQQAFDILIPPLIQLMEELLPIIFDLIEQLLPPIMELITTLLPVIVELLTAILPITVDIAKTVLPVIIDLLQMLLPILEPLIQLLTPILQLVMALLQPLLDLLNLILPPIISVLSKLSEVLAGKIKDAVEKVVEKFTNLREKTAEIFGKIRDKVTEIVTRIQEKFQAFRDKVKEIFEAVRDFIKKPINAVIGFINGLISGVVGGINGLIRLLNKLSFEPPEWVTALTGITRFGFDLSEITAPQIPLLAKGGEVEGAAVVGEDGPELLQTTGRKTRVTPLNENNNAFAGLQEQMDIVISLLREGFGVYLDKRTMVGRLAPDIDRQLGILAAKKERGIG